MAIADDLEKGIAGIEAGVTKIGADLEKLIADFKAGQPVTQAQIDRLNAVASKLTGFDAEVVAADPANTPATT